MDDIYAEINGERVRTVRSPAQLVLADLTEESSPRVGRDAGGRTRVSQITTLGDYKILGADRPVIIGTVGTGSGIEHASGNGTITVTAQGREIACGYLTTNAVIRTGALKKNFLAYLGSSLANSMDTLVLCIQPISAGVTTFGSITFKEY